mgnify:FL=1
MYSNAAISPIYPIPISYNYNVRKSDYEETVLHTMSTLLIYIELNGIIEMPGHS